LNRSEDEREERGEEDCFEERGVRVEARRESNKGMKIFVESKRD